MLLLNTKPDAKRTKNRFHFDKRWTNFPEASKVIETIKRIKEEIQALKDSVSNNKNEKMKELHGKLNDAYNKEELYWAQKARTSWLKEGDKNTKYFDACVPGRRKRNKISGLTRNDSLWVMSDEEIENEIIEYSIKFSKSDKPEDFNEILEGIPHTITEQMNMVLTKPVTEMEIKAAVFDMHPQKSRGPNATEEDAMEIRRILKVYEEASGQKINVDKSSVFFRKNTKDDMIQNVNLLLNGKEWKKDIVKQLLKIQMKF
ncbi:hypothetical protein ACH5RR_037119 [Cinchona calisaya]|uniref:Uncharacterized protein n=1 Tax=Cinchona calisaya TaxID=153742 RepID=A0ABD2Y6Q8_9GENT